MQGGAQPHFQSQEVYDNAPLPYLGRVSVPEYPLSDGEGFDGEDDSSIVEEARMAINLRFLLISHAKIDYCIGLASSPILLV